MKQVEFLKQLLEMIAIQKHLELNGSSERSDVWSGVSTALSAHSMIPYLFFMATVPLPADS